MDKIRIRGGRPLRGEVEISGAKNAALPLMVAALLSDEPLTLSRVPRLADIDTLAKLLGELGVTIEVAENAGHTLTLNAAAVTSTVAPYDLVRRMRASILVLGPLVARFREATVSLPGGCAIGTRPVDLHLAGLERLGARIELEDGYIRASAPGGLKGGEIHLATPSVGATENLMMAAALADGETVLSNAAREPEIADLADCLNAMGAAIEGAGSDRISIRGRPRLSGTRHRIMADRIEAGTYAIAAAITGGAVDLLGARAAHLEMPIECLRQAGVTVEESTAGLAVKAAGRLASVNLTTHPYPGFPTDLQAQIMVLMALAEGASLISETVFENRFMHVPELTRMGADISVSASGALVRGVEGLHGAPVMATDLRASSCLVLAGLAAQGETIISRVYHLDRGYERIETKLAALGADIERIAS
ncbi:MAG: UDP-N-acetylglucosamine 1-carboxyvinyltransferase [Alphaproteobacteria bacterium]|jgi:UDP-N-acetylglucosamine 1-carboxyvinyltransferase|nr:UDP-N-acetylglucosamine 1-carboxyvinyltransferase [Alphaproteobacteria bacterium]MDP6588666.1 UDP-N-acetylglucosamine 1-carboxyvinyltransferase [Alphaproteobacteria bacterium]MDP6819495.1 UDP-N-acetylglucosamine 1-carboxyvinyltransferase [Alphaproteobacteria bacterium]